MGTPKKKKEKGHRKKVPTASTKKKWQEKVNERRILLPLDVWPTWAKLSDENNVHPRDLAAMLIQMVLAFAAGETPTLQYEETASDTTLINRSPKQDSGFPFKKLKFLSSTPGERVNEQPTSGTSGSISSVTNSSQGSVSPTKFSDMEYLASDTTSEKSGGSNIDRSRMVEESLRNTSFQIDFSDNKSEVSEQDSLDATDLQSLTFVDDPSDTTWTPETQSNVCDIEDIGSDPEEDFHFFNVPQGMTQKEMMDLPLQAVDEDLEVQETVDEEIEEDFSNLVEDPSDIVDKPAAIVYHENLLSLANMAAKSKRCSVENCESSIEPQIQTVGTAAIVKWICTSGHANGKWESQKRLSTKGVYAGDFLLAANILLSGNNYNKIALLFKFMRIPCVNQRLFNSIQQHYCVEAIDDCFEKTINEVREKCKDEKLVISGDARNDSPGHSAQFSTYTTMNNRTQDILAMISVDKREAERSSFAMEKLGFEAALEELKEAGLTVDEVVTDAHPQITALMKKRTDMRHQHDIWHAAKNKAKKLMQIAQKSGNKALVEWTKDIITHFWACCEYASNLEGLTDEERVDKMIDKWLGMRYHIIGIHEWPEGKCDHGPLDDQGTAVEPNMVEPSTAEPNTTEPSTAEPSTAEQSTAEPSTAEPSTAGQSTAEPSTAEPSTAEPSTAEQSTAEPSTAEQSTAEPSTAEPSTAEPNTVEPNTAEPPTGDEEGSKKKKKEYLESESPAHEALLDFIQDRALLKQFLYYVRFRHTGQLESFHSLILAYAGKRFAFRYHRHYNKKSGAWSVSAVREKKVYGYISELQEAIVGMKLKDKLPVNRPVKRKASDPRNLGVLAHEQPPPTAELIESKKSRMGKKLPEPKNV